MLFTQPLFFVFFALIFCTVWLIPSHNTRKLLLLVASYTFYAAWDWRFCSLIAISTVIDFLAGQQLGRASEILRRKAWLILSLTANLGILGFFKYYDFFIESGSGLLGLDPSRTMNIVLPVGISFYTFQSMSYTIDIYRRQLKPVSGFTDFALYVSFFPQLVAGPIVRASHFLPQLSTKKSFSDIRFQVAFTLFLIGFIKKACISDNIALLIDPVFAAPDAFTAASLWIATVFYAVQIYCDFSGYTDMAIAIAALLGFQLQLNFRFPYFASNIAEFWQRWHISLSTWLRDYLYIPLGGNRGGSIKTYRNLMITMLLGGLWHGAAWNFVIWGGLHGGALAVHRVIRSRWKNRLPAETILGPLMTFYWVCLTWIFFRCTSLEDAMTMTQAFTLFHASGTNALDPYVALWIIPLGVAHWIAMRRDVAEISDSIPEGIYAAALGVAVITALLFVPADARPFIYFQF